MCKISEKNLGQTSFFFLLSEIAFIKFICKSASSILFVRSKQAAFIRLSFAISLTHTISKATNPQCLGLAVTQLHRRHIKGPIFHTAETISQIIYYNNKKIYILFKINIFS